jgi:hypothetical protein
VAVGRLQPADIHAESACYGRPDLLRFELLALDLAALDDVGRQGPQHGLLAEVEPEVFHAADQSALPMAHRRQRHREAMGVPPELRPVVKLVDIHSPLYMRRLWAGFAALAGATHDMRRIEGEST